jgi:hypothetical protein
MPQRNPNYNKAIETLLSSIFPMPKTQPTKQRKQKPKQRQQPRNQNHPSSFTQSATNSQILRPITAVSAPVSYAPSLRKVGWGLENIRGFPMSWNCGTISIGNNTLGTGAQAYFRTNAGSGGNYFCPTPIPIAPGDTYIGAGYCSDIIKHFATRVYHKVYLDITPIQSSTSNAGEIVVAPFRGGANAQLMTGVNTGIQTALIVSNVISMSGAVVFAPWQGKTIDITPYIAGGFGAKQNEFTCNNIDNGSATFLNGSVDGVGVVPACFAVAGTVAAALNGLDTHRVVVRVVVDLVDFIGGQSLITPLLEQETPPPPPHSHNPSYSPTDVDDLVIVNNKIVRLKTNDK